MGKVKLILQSILSGDGIRYGRKHYKFILFLFGLAVIYITNGLILALETSKKEKLESELLRSKVRYNMRLSEINELNRYPNLIELLKKYNLDLKESDTPPIKIEK